MPVRQRRKRKDLPVHGPEVLEFLGDGTAYGNGGRPPFGSWDDLDHDAIVDAWDALGDEIMTAHVERHPGSRPAGWWLVSAPEPRLQLLPGPRALSGPIRFGMPHRFAGASPDDRYESQRDYLIRLNLMTDTERAAAEATPTADVAARWR